MMKLHIGIAVVFLITTASTSAEEVRDWDRFQLWNDCRPMELGVLFEGDVSEIGLTQNDIEIAARSRLRAARLYSEDKDKTKLSSLRFYVHVVGLAYSISLGYKKIVRDNATMQYFTNPTWFNVYTGTHGLDSDNIISGVAQLTDGFIDEYLRVNDDDC